jgi:hypothetical protein
MTTALFNGFVLPRADLPSTGTHTVTSALNVDQGCFLASLRNCIVPHLSTHRVALLVDVDAVAICRIEDKEEALKLRLERTLTDIGSADDDDVESAAWSVDGSILFVLKTRSFHAFDATSFQCLSSRSLYFHALDVACFPLAKACVANCQCLRDIDDEVESIRHESTADWSSGVVAAVAGADGLQLFHFCTRQRRLSGRFVIVHEFLNIARVCVSQDVSLLAVISVIGHVGVWRLAGDVGVQRTDNFWFHLVDDCERLIDVAFDAASTQLAVTSWDGSLRVFERPEQQPPTSPNDEFSNAWRLVVPDYLTYVDVKHRAGQIAAPLTAIVGANEALLTRDKTLVRVDIRSAAPVTLFQFDSVVRGLFAIGAAALLCATADGTVRVIAAVNGAPRPC